MRLKACILIVSVCGAGMLSAQSNPQPSAQSNPQPSTSTSSSSAPDKSTTSFVRRISAGITLSVLGFSAVSGGSNTVATSTLVSTEYDTKGGSSRIGYGVSGQVSVTDHFAVTIGGYYRKIGYQFLTTVTTTTNVLEGSTVIPTTASTIAHEDTRAHAFDFPVLLRYFGKSRHTPGPRWFVEGGAAYRYVTHLKSSEDTTDDTGVNTCCTFTPVPPQHTTSAGLVVGAGLQLIDPVGIRVIPEVRYTRWENQIFDNFTTHTQRNQLEASITLSF